MDEKKLREYAGLNESRLDEIQATPREISNLLGVVDAEIRKNRKEAKKVLTDMVKEDQKSAQIVESWLSDFVDAMDELAEK